MGQEFIQIFTEMGIVSGIFLTLGIILCIIEIFIPGIGFCGYLGTGCTILGLILRCIDGLSLYQFLLLSMLIVGLFTLSICCLIILVKIGVMGDVGLFATGTALPKDYGNSKEYKHLLGKVGKTTTTLGLAGCVKVRGKIYDAISEDTFIDKGKFVKIIRLEDNRLVVRKFWD